MKKLFLIFMICLPGLARAQINGIANESSWVDKNAKMVFPSGKILGSTMEEVAEKTASLI